MPVLHVSYSVNITILYFVLQDRQIQHHIVCPGTTLVYHSASSTYSSRSYAVSVSGPRASDPDLECSLSVPYTIGRAPQERVTGELDLTHTFYAPFGLYAKGKMDQILEGLVREKAMAEDIFISEAMTNKLFEDSADGEHWVNDESTAGPAMT